MTRISTITIIHRSSSCQPITIVRQCDRSTKKINFCFSINIRTHLNPAICTSNIVENPNMSSIRTSIVIFISSYRHTTAIARKSQRTPTLIAGTLSNNIST
jgi:hypothetical protein